jgi:RimJ/RimL family protein N-acetyltransferase
MNIQGKKVTLRAIEERDLETLHKWASDPMTQDGIAEQYFPSSLDFHRAWFARMKDDHLNHRLIVEIPTGIIGISSLVNIDWRNRRAHHGLTLGESSARGKGYGVDAVMATMRYAFDELGLERLDGGMIEYNHASRALYQEKLGWQDEGVRRRYIFRKGRFWDYVPTGITREDYYTLLGRTHYWDAS